MIRLSRVLLLMVVAPQIATAQDSATPTKTSSIFYPAEFVAVLSDFMHMYNAENAQVMENRQGPYRRSIQTSDIDDVVGLVDEYGALLICSLLVAYGYARSPRQDHSEEESNA